MAYHPQRRAPNVSQYIANLNTISPDNAPEDYPGASLDGDLSVFTNAEFFDFDMGEPAPPLDFDADDATRGAANLNFDHEFRYPVDPFVAPLPGANPSQQTSPVQPFATSTGPYPYPTAPTQATTSPAASLAPINTGFPPPSKPSSDTPSTQAPDAKNRPASPIAHAPTSTTESSPGMELSSRAAAEEDKRRRNTAASARFRVKKKQREQALEQTARETSQKAERLERRVAELERENKWLRGLVVEKAAVTTTAGASGEASAEDALQKLAREEKGVGTEAVKGEA